MSTPNLSLITTAFPTDDGKTVEQWMLELGTSSLLTNIKDRTPARINQIFV